MNRFNRVLAGTLMLPVIFGALVLWSMGDRTESADKVPAAVVNLDKPVTTGSGKDKQMVAAGRLLAAGLTSPSDQEASSLGWKLTETEDAQAGLQEGDYYAVVTIPRDFSKTLSKMSGNDPDQGRHHAADQRRLQRRDRRGQQAGHRCRDRAPREHHHGELPQGCREADRQAKSSLGSAADGAGKLSDGNTKVEGGARQLDEGASALAAGLGTLSAGRATSSPPATRSSPAASPSCTTAPASSRTGWACSSAAPTRCRARPGRLADGAGELSEGVGAVHPADQGLVAGLCGQPGCCRRRTRSSARHRAGRGRRRPQCRASSRPAHASSRTAPTSSPTRLPS